MKEILPLTTNMKALEYGAGTGILSFLLSENLDHITMMDSSSGMVKVMEEKVLSRKAVNLLPVCFDLEKENAQEQYHLIFNQMVLHHIQDVQAIFKKFYPMLLPGGILAIADLYPEDGSFHGEGFDGHRGFNPEQLKEILLETGFNNVKHEECYTVKRKQEDDTVRSYPVFILTAYK
jgi:2-polyprenyl-3-methyl-5-hydroxy-6-metoxy-1,4-benzoquinol methylase